MALILSFDTSTSHCSVALHRDGVLLDELSSPEKNAHAARLAVFCRDVLQQNSLEFNELSAVAVGAGPGSYTGLRIGVSLAKGICAAAGIPLISVSSLLNLAAGFMAEFQKNLHPIVAMIDARRDEVFSAILAHDLTFVRETRAEILVPGLFDEFVGSGLIAIGDGANKAKGILQDGRILFHEKHEFPKARNMGALAFEKFEKGQFENIAYFTPFYLKDFVAGKSRFSL